MVNVDTNFSARVVKRLADVEWRAAPKVSGVHRRLLDRITFHDDVARATSVVRYDANAKFPFHTHHGGEEYFVLDGHFCDKDGDHGPGTYIRNPCGSSHEPWTREDGCTIFVKLIQMHKDDPFVKTSFYDEAERQWERSADDPLLETSLLFKSPLTKEVVRLYRWQPGEASRPIVSPDGGMEIYVLSGHFTDKDGEYGDHTWLRLPVGFSFLPTIHAASMWYVRTGAFPVISC
ncbi:unnamed protein product [Vitrella brassicaformis CCMP3155]|uniref:ChrR-like cupin domain-containing protein n=1 Tax=Vitrella brassicaformis (strain CCMP3155) TaxID=1169540 RepID=A0A0G4GSS5_VITBC|nr:unnamed protein product [Vitrella brassicaformis CCMP3155]|eukprot:CEM33731.1 unnamed protein product [Vitrella brassicaformis CCMP3155]